MNCSCRTAALRIFVRTIADSQLPAARTTQASRLSQACQRQTHHRAATAQRGPFASHAPIPPSYRSFGTSAVRKKEETGDTDPGRFWGADSPTRSARPPRTKLRTKPTRQVAPMDKNDRTEDADMPTRENWQIQKAALKAKFPEGWNPRKRLSPDALAGIRALHEQFPEEYTTEVLAEKFEVSAEAIRRILKSKWTPSPEEEIDRQGRWYNRGKKVWERWAALGKKPPQRWRMDGVTRDPSWNEKPGAAAGQGTRNRASARNKLAQTLL